MILKSIYIRLFLSLIFENHNVIYLIMNLFLNIRSLNLSQEVRIDNHFLIVEKTINMIRDL
jgi:hypothetical protein